MGGTFSNFNIAISGLLASQAALNLTGQNIANANTKGYTRQRVSFEANEAIYNRNSAGRVDGLISGVNLKSIDRLRDSFLDGQFRTQNSEVGYSETLSEFSIAMNDILGEPSDSGIAARLNGFFEAASDLAANPEEETAKNVFVNSAISLTDTINQINNGLENLRASLTKNGNGRIDFTVSNINSKLEQLAQLNNLIATSKAVGNAANQLNDERDLILDELSKLIGVDIKETSNGGYEVSILQAPQEAVVVGTNSFASHDSPIIPAINTASNNNTLVFSANNGNGSVTGPVTVTLDDNSSIRDVVNKINLSFEAAGGRGTVASLDDQNRLILQSNTIESSKNSASSQIDITGGTALTALGHSVAVTQGADEAKTVLVDDIGIKHKFDYTQGQNTVGVNPSRLRVVKNDQFSTQVGFVDEAGGDLGALLDISNFEVTELKSDLDRLSMDLKDAVNGLLSLGTTSTGAAGALLFTGNSAEDFSVNASATDNPNVISPGENGAISDGSIAAEIAELFFGNNTSIGSNSTEQKLYIKANDTSAGVTNNIPLIPGEQVRIEAKGVIDDNGSAVNAGTNGFGGGSLLQIEFLNASGAVIGGAVDFPASAGAPEDTVLYTGAAPAGAAFARLKINSTSFNDNNATNNLGHFGVTITRTNAINSSATHNFTDAYANITGKFGARANFAESKEASSTLLIDHIESSRQSTSGVSLEEEAANLIQYQNAFQANARVLSVMDEIIQTILNI